MKKNIKILSVVFLSFVMFVLFSSKIGRLPKIGDFFNPNYGFWHSYEKFNNEEKIKSSEKYKVDSEIIFDNSLIPHIYSKNLKSVFFSMGYLHAQNRLWQMEFMTYVASGRVSEIIGSPAINFDKKQRRIGLKYASEKKLKKILEDERSKQIINSYCDGVNFFISNLDKKNYPIEYKLMDYKPEKWTPLKSMLILSYMAYDLTYSESDINNNFLVKKIGLEEFDKLKPVYAKTIYPIIKKEKYNFENKYKKSNNYFPYDSLLSIKANKNHTAYINKNLPEYHYLGSNNWVVSSQLSNLNSPILANDPHLSLSLPSIWYAIHLNYENNNVYGVSIPGVPGVIIGANENINWGFTNVGIDVVDWYTMYENKNRDKYLFDGKELKYNNKIEVFNTKEGKVFYDTVKYSHFGPVVYDSRFNPMGLNKPVAMKWTLHDQSNELLAIYKINNSLGLEDFKEAIKTFTVPAQNMVFSDKLGNIAIFPNGNLPIRKKNEGRFVQNGSLSSSIWKKYIPKDEMPYDINPKINYLYSANQHTTNPNYPYYYYPIGKYFSNQRAERLDQLISENKNHNIDSYKKMHFDYTNTLATKWIEFFKNNIEKININKTNKKEFEKLLKWNSQYDKNSIEPTIYNNFSKYFDELLWDEFREIEIKITFPLLNVTLENILDGKIEKYYDLKNTTKKETIFDIINLAINKSIEESKDKWGTVNSTNIIHLSRIKDFSETDIKISGCKNCLNAINKVDENKTTGPSWRMITYFKDGENQMYFNYPGGQSGNPVSEYYKTFIDIWSKGEYLKFEVPKSVQEAKSKFSKRITLY